ncbi:MAG TPA: SDR family oxidoreductase [Paracoccus solventivorans]|uniref:SDR family oxidoreductase n=1 Tax=Paracoccus solventivorans TaxID=53463 RepID=A0A832PLA7_9RHOB|nr:SDR family oxidoreductase [Paracoccus solventivorans]HHW33668.1 SDR family oxidoreductase [Paracoccus solventivorans]
MHYDLTGRTAVVLGGTSEIGAAIVETLTKSGSNVVFQGTNEQTGAAIMDRCASHPGTCLFKSADLMQFDQIAAVFTEAKARFGKVDVAVCSGASRRPGPKLLDDMAAEEMVEAYNNRIIPRINGLKAAVDVMIPENYGKIVLISTDAGRTPTPTETIIGSAGAFVNYLARSSARELARNGIRVNAVAITITEGTKAFTELTGKGSVFDKIKSRAAFGLINTQDVADYILYLAAPESDKISGSTMSINGGSSFPSY